MAQPELSQFKAKTFGTLKNGKKSPPPTTDKFPVLESQVGAISRVPKGHVYPIWVIQVAVQHLIQGLISLRGCQLSFELFSAFFEVPTPSFSSIRNWLYRIGLYTLKNTKVYREDWIWIPDFTVELGKLRCLTILGIPQSCFCDPKRGFRDSWDNPDFALRHQDVEVLAIKILYRSTGAKIEEILTQLTEKIGTPLQIVADHGSDLKNGIERYQHKNPNVIYTHDITHHLAILLKQFLSHDVKYPRFCQKCSLTRTQIQQTELHFLTPPKQNSKSRYLNVDDYVKWANQLLAYQAQNDYSQISQTYVLDKETYTLLEGQPFQKALKKMGSQTYANQKLFLEALTAARGSQVNQFDFARICQAAHLGKRQFMKNFGWLEEYRPELFTYTQMVKMALRVEAQVKNFGLNKKSLALFKKDNDFINLYPISQAFKQKIIDYLSDECAKLPKNQTLLATSDIIESRFGKYKQFTSTNCLKELGKRILTLPLCTHSITAELVKNAMENISERDVENWTNDIFGQSVLSKRRKAFPSLKMT
jgi:hypothetical protein